MMHELIQKARALRLAKLLLFGVSGAQTATEQKVDEQLREFQGRFAALEKANDAILGSMEFKEGEPIVIDAEKQADFRKNLEQLTSIRDQIVTLKSAKDLQDWGVAPQGDPITLAAAAAAQIVEGRRASQGKSLGRRFVESEEFKQMVKSGRLTMDSPFDVGSSLGYVERKDVYSDLPTGTPGTFGTITRDPLVPSAQRTMRVRDLFPARPTTSSVIEYFRVTGFTNNASVVPERSASAFALKPQSTLTIKGEQAVVRTIAHYEIAHRNALADEPQLQALIENELLYGLRLAEDNQILNGTGTGEDLQGITTTSGVQTTAVTGNIADRIRKAITLVFLANYEATGVVLHPSDFESLELLKSAGSEQLYLFTASLQIGGEPRVWRLPVVQTPAITQGNALIGAFGLGAQLYDRENATIRIAEQHADFFLRNAVAVLAESRLALACKRPESFWYGDVTP